MSVVGACLTCGKELKDYRTCEANDPAMNCGGDCLDCMRVAEGCVIDEVSSTVCQRGTRSCEVDHDWARNGKTA